ncbi:unnamed protein product [Arabis nemorensis]|uniref:BHLH domain-containing protein n=1 Tax=Arabis nemorensis TaxID=586526 RepID=A0A565BIU2_9BRAS|nr:unnamed protein product [Arabis nemorensis]
MKIRFTELSTILEHGRPPKTDKVAILNDAIRMLNQDEKNELHDEKQNLKIEKERIEQQTEGD